MYYDENEDEVERLRSRRSRPAPRPRTGTSSNHKKHQGSYEKGSENDYLFAEAEGSQIQVPFAGEDEQPVRKKSNSSGSNRSRSTVPTAKSAAKGSSHPASRKNAGTGKTKKKQKKRSFKKLLLAILAIFLLYEAWLFLHKPTGLWTVAVFGVDSRDGNTEKALADVQIICQLDRSTGEIKLVSVYRDTYLKIDSQGNYHRINEAYFKGGHKQAVDALEENLDIKIDDYAAFNWKTVAEAINVLGGIDINITYFKGGHKQAVDALEENLDIKIDDYAAFNWKTVAEAINVLGGIDINITPAEFKQINGYITETVQSTGIGSYQLSHDGPNHLDGVQAVAYCRLRKMDTDFQRTERQRTVIQLTLEKAKQADVSVLSQLAQVVLSQISTSISANDVLPLIKKRQRTVIQLTLEKAKQADVSVLSQLAQVVLSQISTSISANDVLPLIKKIDSCYISETGGFPFSKQGARVGKMDCVIPTTLESNVILLHQFLYGEDVSYHPSAAVKKISAHISEKTGLYEEGKPALPGSSSGSGSSQKETQAPPPTQAPEETTAPDVTEESLPEETVPEETETIEETEEEIGPGISDNIKETAETKKEEEIGPGVSPDRPVKPTEEAPQTKPQDDPASKGPGAAETTGPKEEISSPGPSESKDASEAGPGI